MWFQKTPLYPAGSVNIGRKLQRRIASLEQLEDRETALSTFALRESLLDVERLSSHQARLVDATGAIRPARAGFPGRRMLGVDTTNFERKQYERFGHGDVTISVLRFTKPRIGESRARRILGRSSGSATVTNGSLSDHTPACTETRKPAVLPGREWGGLTEVADSAAVSHDVDALHVGGHARRHHLVPQPGGRPFRYRWS